MISRSDWRSGLRQSDIDERLPSADIFKNGAVKSDVMKSLPFVFAAVDKHDTLLLWGPAKVGTENDFFARILKKMF